MSDDPPAPVTVAYDPGANPLDWVEPSLSGVAGWESVYGDRKAFRVRGVGWFRSSILRDFNKLRSFTARLAEARNARRGWKALDISSDDGHFNDNFRRVRQRKGLTFESAANFMLLCEIAAAEQGVPASVVHESMRIEPAIFGIDNLTTDVLKKAVARSSNLLASLRRGAAQVSERVFWDMAEGQAVSYRLACRTLEILHQNNVGEIKPEGVIIIPDRRGRPAFVVSGREKIDGPSVPEGVPRAFRPPRPWPKPGEPPPPPSR